MTPDERRGLLALARALNSDAAVPVPATWLIELLDGPAALPHPAETTAANRQGATVEDHLLTVNEAAGRLGVTCDWLYRHHKALPFTVKLGRKVLRFSAAKLDRYLESRRRAAAA